MARSMAKVSFTAALLAALVPAAARADFVTFQYPSRMDPLPAAGPKNSLDSDGADEIYKDNHAIGFDFVWQGKTYTEVTVTSNGALSFEDHCSVAWGAQCMGDNPPGDFQSVIKNDPNTYIAAWWGNLDVLKNVTQIRHSTTGDKPNRVFTVEWLSIPEKAVGTAIGNTYSFQIKLYETSNIAVLQYGDRIAGAHDAGTRFTAAGEAQADAQGDVAGDTFLDCATSCSPNDFPATQAIMVPTPANAELAPYVSFSGVSADGTNLSFTVKSELYNAGRASAADASYEVYFSTDRTITAGDTHLATADASGISLASYGSHSKSTSVSIARPADGIYYLGIIADTLGSEPITGNNTVSSHDEIVVGKDLVGQILSAPGESGPGEPAVIRLTLTNRGTDTSGNFSYKVYLSADKVLDARDKEVVLDPVPNTSLGAGLSSTVNVNGVIPADSEGGNFYYLLKVDSGSAVAEASENNNVSVGPLVVVTPPDLVMNSFSLIGGPKEVYYGREIVAEMTISNVGGAVGRGFFTELKHSGKDGVITARDAAAWVAPLLCADESECVGAYAGPCDFDSLQCKPDCIRDADCPDQLSCFQGACTMQLQPGETRSFRVTGVIPTKDGIQLEDLVPGDCLFGAMINGNELVKEVPNGSSNNTKVMPTAIKCRYPAADAHAREFFAPTRAAAGEAITVFRTIRNDGNEYAMVKDGTGKLVRGKIRYEYVLSWNDVVTHKDSILTIVGKGPYGELDLGPGEEDQGVDQIVLPANLATSPSGYRIGVIVDPERQIDELVEENNVTVAPERLTVISGSLFIVQEALPTAVVDVPILYQLRAIGGDGRFEWNLHKSSLPLPEGLTLSSTGLLSGVLTEAALEEVDVSLPGNVVFSVEVHSGGATDVQTFLLPVVRPTGPLTIETGACQAPTDEDCARKLPVGYTGRPYMASISASGGQPPYKWKVTASGNGITADGNVLSGTPDTPATLTIQAQVQDARGVSTPVKQLSLRIVEPSTLTILTGSLQPADVGVVYIGNFDATGGDEATRQWYIDPNKLPPGLTYESGVRCKVTGTPTREGLYTFPVRVFDGDGNTDESYFSILVQGGKTFTIQTKALPEVTVGNEYLEQLRATTAVTWSIVSGGLPEGLQLTEGGEILGTVPETAKTGVYAFAVAAVDVNFSRQVASLAINVKPRPITYKYKVTETGCATSGGLPGLGAVLSVLALLALRRRR